MVVIDVRTDKLDMARELGAIHVINAAIDDPDIVLRELGGADAAIVPAVSPKPFEQAFGGMRRGGRLVFVGLPADNEISLPIKTGRSDRLLRDARFVT